MARGDDCDLVATITARRRPGLSAELGSSGGERGARRPPATQRMCPPAETVPLSAGYGPVQSEAQQFAFCRGCFPNWFVLEF